MESESKPASLSEPLPPLRVPNDELNTTIYRLKLSCGHAVTTDVLLKVPRRDDKHYVFCPPCRQADRGPLAAPLCWHEVTSVQGFTDSEQLYQLYGGLPHVLPQDILRVQPTIPLARVRPFPYVSRRPS